MTSDRKPSMRTANALLTLIALPLATTQAQTDTALPRRPFFGAQVAPRPGPPDSTGAGIVVRTVLPGSPASAVLAQGDIILAFNGESVRTVPHFLALLRRISPGATPRIDLRRGDSTIQRTLSMVELKREEAEGYELIYTALGQTGQRHRVILTRPPAKVKAPAVLLMGGIGCYSVDNPLTPPDAYLRMLQGLTRLGFVTMRVEKTGMGDSEGDCSTQDFDNELTGYVAGASLLRALPYVDSNRVFLLGHSIGGLHDPLVAARVPVRGVIAIATVVQPWFDYEIENTRRQLSLGGLSGADLDSAVQTKRKCMTRYLLNGEPRARLVADQPDCVDFTRYGTSDRYIQQVAALDLRSAWARLSSPVLALYPGSDFVTALHDHEEIAAIVNRSHPGQARAEVVPGTDHQLQRVASQQESFQIATQGAPAQPFNERIVEVIGNWLEKQG